jgi:hypothetical protein
MSGFAANRVLDWPGPQPLHAMRDKDAAAARVWDAIQERDHAEKLKKVN